MTLTSQRLWRASILKGSVLTIRTLSFGRPAEAATAQPSSGKRVFLDLIWRNDRAGRGAQSEAGFKGGLAPPSQAA